MPRLSSRYRSRWGSDFSFEPEDVYVEKERERTRRLVNTAQQQRYGGPPPIWGNLVREPYRIATEAAQAIQSEKADLERQRTRTSGEGGGGGFFGTLKNIGGKALDALDTASETTFDVVTAGGPFNPIGQTVNQGVAAVDTARNLVRGQNPVSAFTNAQRGAFGRTFGGGLPQNIVESRGNPAGIYRRQLEDFQRRPVEERLAIGAVFDPTNAIGAPAVTQGLRGGATAARVGRSASLLRKAARANEVLDVAQARFAPEIAGGVAGAIGASATGNNPLKGAAVGAAVGAGAHLGGRALGRRVATTAIPALGIEDVFKAGDDVVDSAGRVWKVADATDPSLLRVTNDVGTEARIGRNAVRKIGGEAAQEAAPAAERAIPTPEPQQTPLATETPRSRSLGRKLGEAAGETPPAAAETPPVSAAEPPVEPTRPTAQAPEARPRRDLFDLPTRDEAIRAAEERRSTALGRAGQRASEMRGLGDPVVDATRQQIRRSAHVINDFVPEFTESAFRKIEASGLEFVPDETGRRFVLKGTNATLPDIVEGGTPQLAAIRASLTDDQLEALDQLRWLNEYVNDTRAFYGLDPHEFDTATGDWFPRRVVAKDVESGRIPKDVFRQTGRGRRISGNRQGARTFTLEEQGAAQGFVYDSPRNAFEAGMRAKLLEAQDAMIAQMIEPLAVKGETAGFGFRSLREDHPLLDKFKYVGGETRQVTPRGATEPITERTAMLGRQRPVFPNEIADQLDELLSSQQINFAPARAAQRLNQYAIPLRASADLSQRFNQGIGFITSSPRNAAKAMRSVPEVVRSASGNPGVYDDLLQPELKRISDALVEGAAKETDARLYAAQRGLHFATGAQTDEFLFPEGSKILKPFEGVLRWSNDTFARAGNYDRTVLFADNLERAVKSGLKGDELAQHMDDAVKALNRYGGWTGTKTTKLENVAMFAPRYFRSQVEQIAAALTKGNIEGQLARRHLGSLLASAAVLTYGANELRGYDTEWDPRDANFMRLRNVFGHDISPIGPFATLIRGVAQTAGGDPFTGEKGLPPFLGFARAKSAPWASTAWSLITGKTFDERPITGDIINRPAEALQSGADIALESLPFSVQAFRDAGGVSANPEDIARGLGATALSATGIQGSETTPSELRDFARDDVAQELFGRSYDDLLGSEKAQVNRDERVSKHQEEADRRGLQRENRATEIGVEFRDKMAAAARYLEAGKDDAGNFYSGDDYREAYHDANLIRRTQYEELNDDPAGGDDVVDGYFALYDLAEQADGQPDYDKFEDLAAGYATEHPDVYDRVAKVTGTRDDETLQRLREAQKQAREYWNIPPVRGLSLEDGHRANAILAQANARVNAGAAPNRRAALGQMVADGRITQEEMGMALQASRLGSNPERKQFRVNHPEFAIFYGGAAGVTPDDLLYPVSQSQARRTSARRRGGTGPGSASRRSRTRTRSGLRR